MVKIVHHTLLIVQKEITYSTQKPSRSLVKLLQSRRHIITRYRVGRNKGKSIWQKRIKYITVQITQ